MNNSMGFFFPAHVSAVLAKIIVVQALCLLLKHNIFEKTNQLLFLPLTDCRLEEFKALTVHP